MTPLPAARAVDAFFPEARGHLLDLAAFLDRVDRGAGAAEAAADPRLGQLRRALAVLAGGPVGGRAEAVQIIFSDPYDPDWPRPTPR